MYSSTNLTGSHPNLTSLAGSFLYRQADKETRLARPGLERDFPAMARDYAPHDVQSEACTLADLLGGEERLEDVVSRLARYPQPVVRDLHDYAIPLPVRTYPYPPVTIHGI